MAHRTRGRHRAPSRFSNAGTALTAAAKVTAVAATSGGLAAAAFVPATASPSGVVNSVATATPAATASESLAQVVAAGAPATTASAANVSAFVAPASRLTADPTDGIFRPGEVVGDSPVVAAAAPDDAPERTVAYGELGFTGSAVPAPEPEPEPVAAEEPTRTQSAASRSDAREEAPVEEAAEEVVEEVVQETAPAATTTEAAPAAAPASSGGSGVLAFAAQNTGIPYVWGGSSPATGFDCSGFTSYVFSQAGISLPRTAAQQQSFATPVSNPQPGDLIFFGFPAYHVGIYAGDGMMYDSGTPGTLTSYRAVFGGVSGYGRV